MDYCMVQNKMGNKTLCPLIQIFVLSQTFSAFPKTCTSAGIWWGIRIALDSGPAGPRLFHTDIGQMLLSLMAFPRQFGIISLMIATRPARSRPAK